VRRSFASKPRHAAALGKSGMVLCERNATLRPGMLRQAVRIDPRMPERTAIGYGAAQGRSAGGIQQHWRSRCGLEPGDGLYANLLPNMAADLLDWPALGPFCLRTAYAGGTVTAAAWAAPPVPTLRRCCRSAGQ